MSFFVIFEDLIKNNFQYEYLQETGLAIGGPNMTPFVMLEVHYNNPDLKDG